MDWLLWVVRAILIAVGIILAIIILILVPISIFFIESLTWEI